MSYSSDHPNNLDEHDHSSGPVRRARGRPPGSKNKPRQAVIITRDNPNALRSHVLEICDGADIVESLAKFAKTKGRAVSVLSGTGVVADVTLRQPADPPSDVVTLYGRFQILTITGTILPPPAPANAGGLSIFMGGVEGQVMGGIPIGPLIASGPVILIATSFANAVFERLPIDEPEEEEEQEEENGASGKVQPTASQSSSVTSGGGVGGVAMFNATNGDGGSDYPFSGDVMGWAQVQEIHTNVSRYE